jgi:hypothetical protein
MNPSDYREIVDAAGGKFISIHENVCYFWDEMETRVLSLCVWAVTPETVAPTSKNTHEPALDFPPLLQC